MLLNNSEEIKKINDIKKGLFNLRIDKFFKRVKDFTVFRKKRKEISRLYNLINLKIKNKI